MFWPFIGPPSICDSIFGFDYKELGRIAQMTKMITMKMYDNEVAMILPRNVISKASIRSAFLLPPEAIIALTYQKLDRKLYCRTNSKGTFFVLPEEFPDLRFTLKSNEAPSRPITAADLKGSTPIKRPKIEPEFDPLPVHDHMVSRIGQYALFYTRGDNRKIMAIPLTNTLAATVRHGANANLKIGDCIKLFSDKNPKMIVDTSIVLINELLDFILIQSKSAQLSDKNLIMEALEPKIGMKYTLMGYSTIHGGTSRLSFLPGVISSDITLRMRFLGSSGSFKGDSGGGCWSDDGRLIGMQVDTVTTAHTAANHGQPAASRQSSILPIARIYGFTLPFLPPEEDIDWEE